MEGGRRKTVEEVRGLSFLILLGFLVVPLACHSGGGLDRSRPITVVAPWRLKGKDPLVAGYVLVRMGCLETLTASDGRGGIEPCLAERWGVSADGLTWRFTLRRGVRFHDGTPLSAEGVAVVLRRAFQRHKLFSAAAVEVRKVEAASPRDVLVTTAAPFSPLPAYLAHYGTAVIPPSCFSDDGRVVSVIGTGPYRLVAAGMDTFLEFKAFDGYWGPRPSFSEVRYLAVASPETRALMAEAGEADLALTLSPTAAASLERGHRVQVLHTVMPRLRLVMVNTALPFFDSEEERRALSLAIDREGIAGGLLLNRRVAATQLLPAASGRWYDPALEPLHFDRDEALRLLGRNGWKRGVDGVLQGDRRRFEVSLITYASRPMLPLIAQALQEQWSRIGVRVRISLLEASEIYQRHENGTLEMALYSQNFGLVPDEIGTIAYDFGPLAGRWGWGAMGWESKTMNLLIRRYCASFDETEAAGIRKRIDGLIQRELPLIPVTWYDHRAAVGRRIRGVRLDPYELRPYLEGARWAE